MFKSRLTSVVGLLAVTLILCLSLSPAQAQEPQLDHFIYLPLILKSGPTAPPVSYAQILAIVQQVCPATGLNQVCYVNGQITLEPKTGTIPFSQPGAIADLVDVQRLRLASTGADPQKWSLAWLRLAADSDTPDQELTVLAFGNVVISNILPFTGQPPPEDGTILPALQFTSQPVAGITEAGSSGLIVTNSTEDQPLSLTLDGAVISLASTTLNEAQPGSQMKVTTASGFSTTEAQGQSSVAMQGQQVTLPLDVTVRVSGPPARAAKYDSLMSVVFPDLLAPLVSDEVLAQRALLRLNRAIDRCIAGQPAYIYNVLFWTRAIAGNDDLSSNVEWAGWIDAYSRAYQCLTFEVDFDSTVRTDTPKTTQSSHTQAQGLRMQFDAGGEFLFGGKRTLVYDSYQLTGFPCSLSISKADGLLETVDGRLRVAGNRVQIDSSIRVSTWPTDQAMAHCYPAPPFVVSSRHWQVGFSMAHQDLLDQMQGSFKFTDWRHTGGEHFGEAIYTRFMDAESAVINTTTYLIMIHTPIR